MEMGPPFYVVMTLTNLSTSLKTENADNNLFTNYNYNFYKDILARTQLLPALGYRTVLNVEPCTVQVQHVDTHHIQGCDALIWV